jgi:hypothetical protein
LESFILLEVFLLVGVDHCGVVILAIAFDLAFVILQLFEEGCEKSMSLSGELFALSFV